ncbi:MAG TPA: dihydrofolate reductase family protein [Chryseolinea sp.]
MGKIVSFINTTPDGFADSQYVTPDIEYFEFIHDLLAEAQTVAYGRNTFELFQQLWPARLASDDAPYWQVKMAQALTDIPKQVYSSILNSTTWNNSTIVKAIDVKAIRRFKQEDQKDLLTFGSLGLVAALTQNQLVDEYYFCIHPLVAGGGNARLFSKIKLNAPQPLKLKSTKVLQSGVVIVHYERADQ